MADVAQAGFFDRTKAFITDVLEEMRKVTWPDWPQVRNSTWVILIFVLIVAFIIWMMDASVRTLVDVIVDLFA